MRGCRRVSDETHELRVWKHSHGTNQTAPDLAGKREQLIQDRLLTIYRDTDRKRSQGAKFREKMREGDFFYLCHGNDVQLCGQIKSALKNPKAAWVQRGYKVIRFRVAKSHPRFEGHKKAWSPSGNTTCWQVPKPELKDFERDILKPFFGLALGDLGRISSELKTKEPAGESRDLKRQAPPWLKTPQRYHAPYSPGAESRSSEESFRTYDPDKTKSRKAAHEKCLKRFARLFPRRREYASNSDLLVVMERKVLLVEVKTIRSDEKEQLRLALGQVLYYENLCVRPHYPSRNVYRLVVTDSEPPSYLVQLLEKYRIGAVWLPRSGKPGKSRLGGRILKNFNAKRI